MKTEEFYIGWLARAPQAIARFIKKYLLVIIPLAILLSGLLALSQKKFGSGNFEFGQLTEIRGIYYSQPVPAIKVIYGRDMPGRLSYLTIPLVGYGKHGAAGALAELAASQHSTLEGKECSIKGTLLYNDGKTVMQIDANDHPLVAIASSEATAGLPRDKKDLGLVTLKGEIIDPKCFFGVMKPGEGKPHRDCAIRCILGGIPPMFCVKDQQGRANYYLLSLPNGDAVNELVQNFVAEPIALSAHAYQIDDWILLELTGKEGISKISLSALHQPGMVVACVMPTANNP